MIGIIRDCVNIYDMTTAAMIAGFVVHTSHSCSWDTEADHKLEVSQGFTVRPWFINKSKSKMSNERISLQCEDPTKLRDHLIYSAHVVLSVLVGKGQILNLAFSCCSCWIEYMNTEVDGGSTGCLLSRP